MNSKTAKGRVLILGVTAVLIVVCASAVVGKLRQQAEAASCPAALQSPITSEVVLNANDYIGDNTIDCSSVDIEIQNGGTLRIVPYINDNDQHTDDYGLVIQASSFTVDIGGTIDLEGEGYGPGVQSAHVGSFPDCR